MSIFRTITQGGQVHIHQLHMLKQVVMAGMIVAFVTGLSYFSWKSYNFLGYEWRVLSQVTWAKFMIATTPSEQHPNLYQEYVPLKGKPYKRSCLNILKDPLLRKTTEQIEMRLGKAFYTSLWMALAGFLIVMALWFFMGRRQKQTDHQRGTTLLPWRKLATLIKKEDQASDLNFGDMPLLKDKETSHILITGTTGSGKTNSFHGLLPQVRRRGDRAVILDATGDYVSRYYNKKTDIILNPLDERSLPWNPWADCRLDSHYDVLAESLIQPKGGNSDPFWDKASRALLKTALRKYAYHKKDNIGELTAFLMHSEDKEFEKFFKGTEAASFASSSNTKTTHSIRSVLSSQIEGFRHLESSDQKKKDNKESRDNKNSQNNEENNNHKSQEECKNSKDSDNSEQQISVYPHYFPDQYSSSGKKENTEEKPEPSFSIRKWINGEKQEIGTQKNNGGGWLFITARADQRQSLTPLISAWMDIAINALMVLPEDYSRRLWFILDELAALQNLPSLQRGLAEGRKYGGCFLAGFQSKPQLEDIYGRSAAETMLDLFNTKVFFRCTEPSTQTWISKVLGDKEETEPQENISYGANSTRDGVSLSRQTRQKPLILPTEFSQLQDLECYVKLPGDYPCTKFQMTYQAATSHIPPFLLKPEKKREYPTYEEQVEEEEVPQEDNEY
ncbi:MAG: type IV secretion system DNA-binding domain-containing protein [Alphaproteobacteria bacterium]|jgi:type IV secretory pathway TraG/TraD family ATPase VirD4|nr:type IV secretion system DNA-binding domain-containing protein [Alphaproteobacteria bacterium]MBP9776810.1 type IV secretion system DNA-binding domain-containing protein [Alphaproteobacteria bacterium]